ncbi:sensor histidine kinase [Desulfosediminicola ganghwensis]|uniref:sensor histidine kinase n=1 Tax=Desulfosediminicola ganghwensis TaxID=2569540 RepID=UPI0010AB5DD8|nr:HAMP domain-containing sensor histidine kinase [Desulfosediminicola ganghwensis]
MPALDIRFKMIVVLASYIIGILVMFFVAQNDLLTAKEKLETLELAYKLDTMVLEVRRYEKNFLLYRTEGALENNRKQIELALETMAEIDVLAMKFKVRPLLAELRNTLLAYKEQMEILANLPRGTDGNAPNILSDGVRIEGQKMNELSEELVAFEHKQIRIILEELIFRLVVWSFIAIMVGIIVPLIMFLKVFKPLNIIKKATEDIAHGRFSPIEVVDTRDEMEQMIDAFNTMVSELQRRQDQLVQSQKLSSIGTLSAGIAHQLNNPLNNISTSCQIAISDFETGERDFILKMLNNINKETARARDVVQGLLEFSREKEFALRYANLKEVVNRAANLVHSQVPSSIEVVVDIPSSLNMPMDFQGMQEVFLNLIINASHAINGAGRITISARESTDSDTVLISVHDTGCGIPADIQGRLFDPFFSTKEEGQGTGLGLSITYGIIQKHEGNISVDSEPGKGTTFLISLPLRSDGERESKGTG